MVCVNLLHLLCTTYHSFVVNLTLAYCIYLVKCLEMRMVVNIQVRRNAVWSDYRYLAG